MKIVNIVQSTHIKTGKVKYFLDHLQASFHIQSGGGSAFQFDLKPCTALFNDNDSAYYVLTKPDVQCEIDTTKLAPNSIHHAAKYYIETYDGGGSGFGKSEGYEVIKLNNSNPNIYSYYSNNPFTIFIDESRTVHKMGDRVEIQKPAPEYTAIQSTIESALAHAAQRQSAEFKQAQTLFGQRKIEFDRAKQELERKKAELDMEAAALASDAMDYTQ